MNIINYILEFLLIYFILKVICNKNNKKIINKSLKAYYIFISLKLLLITLLSINKIKYNVQVELLYIELLCIFITILIVIKKKYNITKKGRVVNLERKTNLLLTLYLLSLSLINMCITIYLLTHFINIKLILLIILYLLTTYLILKLIEIITIKNEILLEMIDNYEISLENLKGLKHQMLNNLILLSSYKDKNNDAFDLTLQDISSSYLDNKICLLNLDNIPSGIKSIIYYKLNDLLSSNEDIIINISDEINEAISNLERNDYNVFCELMELFIDNAVEEINKCNNKLLVIDMYEEDDKIYFYIENNISSAVDINKINNKNYSTKGKNRGLGLYLAKKIKTKSNNVSYTQEINNLNHFTTELTVSIKPNMS